MFLFMGRRLTVSGWALGVLGALGAAGFLCATRGAAEVLIEERDMPPGVDEHYKKYIEKKKAMRERAAQARAQLRAQVEDRLRAIQDKRKNTLEPLAKGEVKVDEETLPVQEPNSMEAALGRKTIHDEYEVSPQDFDLYVHDRWSLNKNDFRFDKPRYFIAEGRQGHMQSWWGFSYSITNSSTKPRRIAPIFVAVTNKGSFRYQSGGYLPQRMLADSTFHPLAMSTLARDTKWLGANVIPLESPATMNTQRLGDKLAFQPLGPAPEPMRTFAPGQTRWGVALWPRFNDEFTELKVVIHGLSNAHRYDRKQRRVLVLTFTRDDDEFHVQRYSLKYQGKKWEYLWMWDQDIRVPIPEDPSDPQIKEKTLATPAGGQRLVWSFPYTIQNSTASAQAISIQEVRFVLRGPKEGLKWKGFEVDVGGRKATLPEVAIVDNGRSTIYKAQYLRELGESNPGRERNRFVTDPEKLREPGYTIHHIKPGQKIKGRAVFDINDVDWEEVFARVEARLTLKLDKKALSEKRWKELVERIAKGNKKLAGKNPGFLLDPRRRLTNDTVSLKDGRVFTGNVVLNNAAWVILESAKEGRLEFPRKDVAKVVLGERAQVKKQILEALAPALAAAKKDKKVVAYFQCRAGLASGKYRIARSYRQRGVIKEEWLKAWEALDKK